MCKQAIDNVIAAKDLLEEALKTARKEAHDKAAMCGHCSKHYDVGTSLTAAIHHLKTVDMFIKEAKRNNL